MKKQTIIIIIIAAILIFSGILLFSCSNKTSDLTIENVSNERIFFPKIYDTKIIGLSDKGIILSSLNLSDNKKNQIYNEEILGAQEVYYSPDGNFVYIYSNYPQNNLQFINLKEGNQQQLNNNIMNIINKKDNKINYVYTVVPGPQGDENYTLTINSSKYDGGDWEILKDLTAYDVKGIKLFDINNQLYYLIMDSQGKSVLYKYISKDGQDEKIFEHDNLIDNISISPNGQKIAYNNQDNNFIIRDLTKDKDVDTNIKQVNINSIVWTADSNNLYYLKDLSIIYKIDAFNGKNMTYNLNNASVDQTSNILNSDIGNLTLDTTQNILYFSYNYYIYKIKLK